MSHSLGSTREETRDPIVAEEIVGESQQGSVEAFDGLHPEGQDVVSQPGTLRTVESERIQESTEYRRTHYRVYDENGFVSAFAVTPPENATMPSVAAYLCEKFEGTGGTGFESKDLVVLLGHRIVAVVRKGRDGQAVVTTFVD